MKCPNDGSRMMPRTGDRTVMVKGVEVTYKPTHLLCPVCGIEADTPELAVKNQKSLADAYRKNVGLLTSSEIVEARKRRGWSQEDLAREARVGVASVKRWELGGIQSRANDDALRRALFGVRIDARDYDGGRPLSLPRVRLVLDYLGKRLRRRLLTVRSRDKLLYAGKYLFYADMVAFRDIGRSMTGATYAALPHGPQINNYSELLPLIRSADPDEAEPLTEREKEILDEITRRFPSNQSVYDASHQEPAWREKPIGGLIPYCDAHRITAL